MLKKIFLFSVFFFLYSGLYAYDFSNDEFNHYVGKYSIDNTYIIDKIKFVAQAPLQTKGNWNKHYESCEEASLFLSHYNINGLYIDRQVADKEFDKLNYFEEKNLGIIKDKPHNEESGLLYLRDIRISQIHELAKEFYGYTDENSHVISNPSVETLKYLITNDYIIIIPSNTVTLSNPNFNLLTNSYHVINLVGYDAVNFIAFDPGTSKGAYFKYTYDRVIKGIRQNGNNILVLEGERNKNNIDFSYVNNEIIFSKKVNNLLLKINKVLDKNPENREEILKKVIYNISKIKNNVDNNQYKLFSALNLKLEEKLKNLLSKKESISFIKN